MQEINITSFGKRYTNLREIGAGGMGRIYKAYDTIRTEEVALKEMNRYHLDSPAALLHFKNEFRLMTAFHHPNTVEVFEYGLSDQNIPFISMEFVDGQNLSDLSDLSISRVIDILGQICQALAYIHSRLYVHRDLKPDNIKLLPNGRLKLLDYGLMTQLGAQTPGKISGTLYYLAPEIIVGGIMSQSADLYALGIIAYELLTGQRPFDGSKREILQGHLKRAPLEPIALRPDIPPSLDAIIMKLLAKEQSQRYQSSAAVLEDLQYLGGKKWPTELIETTAQKEGYLYSSRLIGREDEIKRFQQLLTQLLKQKEGASLFIGALSGVGKTRLLNEMKTLAQLEGVETIYLDDRRAGEYLHDVDTARQSPLILFLDDAQWMDIKSIGRLNELIQANSPNLLITSAFRPNEIEKTSPLWHTLEEGESEYLALTPLNQKQTRRLIEMLLHPTAISKEFAAFCFNNCGGNAFDLMELLRYLIAEGHLTKSGDRWLEPLNIEQLSLPEKLEECLLVRVNKLSAESRILAGAASVLGNELELEQWQNVSAYQEGPFFQAIDALTENQIVVKLNGAYQFAHDKIRTTLYENLPETQKRSFHRHAATFFEAKLPKTPTLVAAVAGHFVAAQDSDKAIDYSLQSARAAEQNQSEWEAFDHYRAAARFLEASPDYPNREALLLEIYEKAAQFSSAAWTDPALSLRWLQKVIDFHSAEGHHEAVFNLSLSYIVASAVTSNYSAARQKIADISGNIQSDTLSWAVLYGAGVCLIDWYQGYQNDCFEHASAAIDIFEAQLDALPADAWPAYTWAIFWRDKARAYLGQPIEMANIEKNRQLMEEGKSDGTIYWHTLTAVGARAAFTGRWDELLAWKELASRLSREMGKIYWFECWISHSYLYGALHHGEFSQVEKHIERVQASPDPYQVRLAYLFRGRYYLIRGDYSLAAKNLQTFLQMESESPDNSYLEGLIFLAQTYLNAGAADRAEEYIARGLELAAGGNYANPLYRLQFWQLQAQQAMKAENYAQAEEHLRQSLALAQSLDNPIQRGFARKLWGLLHLEQQDRAAAAQQLSQARDIFLSLDNKYQAGQVTAILDGFISPAKSDERPGRQAEPPAHLAMTEFDTPLDDTQLGTD